MIFVNQVNRVANKSLMLSSFMVQAQNAEPMATVSSSNAPSNATEETAAFHFPQWPQRRQAKEEVVPPPPPGPYMSAALNGGSVKAPSFGNNNRNKRRAMSFDSSNVTMDTFSPDIPWPTSMRPPSRWVPDNGYQYVQPQAMQNTQQRVPDNQYRPRSGPPMNWMPSMEHSNYQNQARPYSNNANTYMPPRGFVNQRPQQGRQQ